MAGAVLAESVPANSLVTAGQARVEARPGKNHRPHLPHRRHPNVAAMAEVAVQKEALGERSFAPAIAVRPHSRRLRDFCRGHRRHRRDGRIRSRRLRGDAERRSRRPRRELCSAAGGVRRVLAGRSPTARRSSGCLVCCARASPRRCRALISPCPCSSAPPARAGGSSSWAARRASARRRQSGYATTSPGLMIVGIEAPEMGFDQNADLRADTLGEGPRGETQSLVRGPWLPQAGDLDATLAV